MTINVQFKRLIDSLCKNGYAICDDFLPTETIRTLAGEAKKQYDNGHLVTAKIGHINKSVNQAVRGDATMWLDEGMGVEYAQEASIQAYFFQMNALKLALNQSLLMNLHAIETHFAIYPIGATYQKHIDQFKYTNNTRQLSSILYLNEAWQTESSGELRLYLDETETLDILPTGGKLVLFLSAKFWHEVLPAKRDRISLTGWFRTRESSII